MSEFRGRERFQPVIRVFVSSTFTDLVYERNTLQDRVWPELERYCLLRGFQFHAIDLRWGVPTEGALDHRTMRICLDELRRAQEVSPRPNFLILLGDRYGWQPLPEELTPEEFSTLEEAAAGNRDYLEILRDWYRLDVNARPAVHLLRSRRESPDGRDYTKDAGGRDTAAWTEVQSVLWALINRAYPSSLLAGRFAEQIEPGRPVPTIVRLQGSATEQEIWHGAFAVADASQHVMAFSREIANPETASGHPQLRDVVNVDSSGDLDDTLHEAVRMLKAQLRHMLGDSYLEAPQRATLQTGLDAAGEPMLEVSTDHLDFLCTHVRERLLPIIQQQIDEYDRVLDTPAGVSLSAEVLRDLTREREHHERFAAERAPIGVFVGRQAERARILAYIEWGGHQPLILHGVSGSGKSAVMAAAAREAAARSDAIVVERYLGTTKRSSDLRSLLTDLCLSLREHFPVDDELPTDIRLMEKELYEQLEKATAEHPIVVFLDALDQLDPADDAHSLWWIRSTPLPPHARVAVSILSDPDDEAAGGPWAALKRRGFLDPANSVAIEHLEPDEARLLWTRWLDRAGRNLSAEQQAAVDARILHGDSPCRHPLYLRILFEEVRRWPSYVSPPPIGASVRELLEPLFDRLSHPAAHGPLVEPALGYLVSARYGLAESELLEILLRDPEYNTKLLSSAQHALPPHARRIPIALWSRLRYDLASYLSERGAPGGTVLQFYHRQVGAYAGERFAGTPTRRYQWHERLAFYFVACAKGPDPPKEWESDSVRGFSECVYHFAKAENCDEAATLLTTFSFLLNKVRLGLLEGVFQDYDMLRRGEHAYVMNSLELWADVFREKAHILRRGNKEWPEHKILLQVAVEHADDSPITLAAEQWLSTDRCDWLWLRRLQRLPHIQRSHCLGTLEGHTSPVSGALELTNRRLLSWSSWDRTIRLWDAQSGACLATLREHADEILGVRQLADGRLLSWSRDKTCRLWDAHIGTSLLTLEGHAQSVLGALELTDGRLLSWSADHTLRLWDGRSGGSLATFVGHTAAVVGAIELADGRLLSWAEGDWWRGDITLRLWDIHASDCFVALEGHSDRICGAIELADGRLLSWAEDKEIRLWSSRGDCLMTLKGHTGLIQGVLELTDKRLLSWAAVDTRTAQHYDDGTLRLWDANSASCLATLEGHAHSVWGAFELADGRLLSWSPDETIRLWDGAAGAYLEKLRIRTHARPGSTRGVRELVDGRILSWTHEGTLSTWDGQTGDCLRTFRAHSDEIREVIELTDGGVLSWSWDTTLRLWRLGDEESHRDIPAHSRKVKGALGLSDGRFLSWSADCQLRLWDAESGECLTTLGGHRSEVNGALELSDGRLLSWGQDAMLCLWNGQNGALLARLEEHSKSIDGAAELVDGRLLSYSADGMAFVWDGQSAACLGRWRCAREPTDYFGEGEGLESEPEHLLPLTRRSAPMPDPSREDHNLVLNCRDRTVQLRRRVLSSIVAAWNGDSNTDTHCLRPDGTVVVSQNDGQVCILKLHFGRHRVSLAGAEELFC